MNLTAYKARWSVDGEGFWISFLVKEEREAQKLAAGMDRPHTLEVKQTRKRRSLDANAYFHVLVSKIADVLKLGFEEVKTNLVVEYGTVERDDEGVMVGFKLPASVDVTKIYRYVKCFDTREENGKLFNCYIVFKHTHMMDSKEMSKLVDGAVHEAKQLEIETMPPDKLAALVEEWHG